MLLYENDGFLEVETKEIKQLCRSIQTVPFGGTGRDKYELHAVLCDYQDKDEQRCRIAFYAKSLKRALVFTVAGSEKASLWQCGKEALLELGFQLESVNLKLSPAMLEVVLRDVPGLASPAEARNQRTEHMRLMGSFQEAYDEDPESGPGKKAALKLSAEKRLNERVGTLRHLLEELLTPQESASDDMETLMTQVKELTSRLADAEESIVSERAQRELSESITSAAEKRIQELEEILVDVETQSSDSLKQKRKIIDLRGRIKELGANLDSANVELERERDKQKQFVDDVKSANKQIVDLENALNNAEGEREKALAKLVEEAAVKSEIEKCLNTAERRIKTLDKALQAVEKEKAQGDEALKVSEALQIELGKVQQMLNETLGLNEGLKEDLAAAVEQSMSLQGRLQDAESKERAKDIEQAELKKQSDQYEQLVKEHESLRDEYDRECSVRKRLEKGAIADDRRLSELEKALAEAESLAEKSEGIKDSPDTPDANAILEKELRELGRSLDQEREARETLEKELQDAHKLIDSLEKMVRATETSTAGKQAQQSSAPGGPVKALEVEKRLQCLEDQLEKEHLVQKRLAKELAAAEKKLTEQEETITQSQALNSEKVVPEKDSKVGEDRKSRSSAPLPHELRPAPKKGAFFRPDWDLQGLPCRTTDQVLKAWETVFNVQIALEGYPSQYCMAFMVVLRLGKQKKLFMLYRLKQNNHTLVCVPAKGPKDEASLQKAIKKGLDFLRKSGFEMDEMSSEHIESTLGRYFLEGG
jgi:chromosome segregation ATPase